jgi:hypothetical protein
VQRKPTPVDPVSLVTVDRQAEGPRGPRGYLLAAVVLFGLVGALRVAHAVSNHEVFGFEATTALLASILWPFVVHDLFAPRVRSWRERRRAATPVAPAEARAKPGLATVIRIDDRRGRRPE